jgi:hypothetical protein
MNDGKNCRVPSCVGGGYRWRNVRRKQSSTFVKYLMKSFVKSTVVIHFLVPQNSTVKSLVKATVVTHFPVT